MRGVLVLTHAIRQLPALVEHMVEVGTQPLLLHRPYLQPCLQPATQQEKEQQIKREQLVTPKPAMLIEGFAS
jgi:hypothetical protein